MNTPVTVFGGNLANGDDYNNGGDAESMNSSRAYSMSQIYVLPSCGIINDDDRWIPAVRK
jgi:hypothetical protein